MSLIIRKLDLHVHTPASHDFRDNSVSPKDIIKQAQAADLDAIAVTDHNAVDYIDRIKKAANQRGFTVFPGVEISCGGSQSGSIHVIALYDPSAEKDDLKMVLGKLNIKGKGEDSLTTKSVSDVIDIIRESGGLPVLAHANSTHGALSDIRGNPRTEVVRNKNLAAVEATASDFKKKEGKRLIDIFKGDDRVYNRKLAVYKSSDNRCPNHGGHCLESIGTEFTYFKMGELSLESLRQCFEDPDSRIIQDYESKKIHSHHPRILSISITGGFLDGETIDFHYGMNSIIGGTGTGKSLAVEFLRFVLDKKPHPVLSKDHKEKLEKQLRVNGVVNILIRDASGDEYELSRSYEGGKDPYDSSSLKCVNKNTRKPYTGDISMLFPTLVYSQNEILEITRDSDAQLRLLDNFRDFDTYQNQVNTITQELSSLDHELYQSIQKSENLEDLKKRLSTKKERLSKIEKQLSGSGRKRSRDPYIKLNGKKLEIESLINEYDELLDKINITISDFEGNKPLYDNTTEDIISIIQSSLADNYEVVIKGLKRSRKAVNAAKASANENLASWLKINKYSECEKKYKEKIKLKKKEEESELERRKTVQSIDNIKKKIANAEKAVKKCISLRENRSKLLSQLKHAKTDYFNERSKQASLITERSNEKLRIIVQHGDNTTTYTKMLKKLKIGSHAENREIKDIVRSITPRDLVDIVLDKDSERLSDKANITKQKAEAIISELSSPANLLQTLSMQYLGYPNDSIEISYRKKDKNYYPLNELSMGQKADALIMIALGDGTMPVIIDQPEDALDIPSIWTDICSRLRIGKHNRQFVFTTHNSSISVSSDSDQFIILEADGEKGRVAKTGSIDQKTIKDDVVGHLEGGYGSYDLKRRKYGL